jgi:CubicO group peptidase (beta-lactamase class C family)
MMKAVVRCVTALSLCAGLVSPVAARPASAGPVPAPKVASICTDVMRTGKLIGLSVAVVDKSGRLVQRQCGVKRIGGKDAVDADTLFPIASMSKAFTTASLALLVERGKLDWDKPVRTYIPEFDMGDPYLNAHFSVRDLLTHRSGMGLGAGDLIFFPGGNGGVADILKVIRNIRPETSLRDRFAYDNLLYVLAGDLIPRLDGRSWADFVRQEIFQPLGMQHCVALPSEFYASADHVTGHEYVPGTDRLAPVNPLANFTDGLAPAGGISCTASDLAKWAQVWLNHGAIDGKRRLLTEKSVDSLVTIVTPVANAVAYDKVGNSHAQGYALGWFIQDYLGRAILQHSGGGPGTTSFIEIMPEEGVAAIGLTNAYVAGPSFAAEALIDAAIAGRPLPKPDPIGALAKRQASHEKDMVAMGGDAVKRPADAKPVLLPLSAFAGTYTDPWYGPTTIAVANGTLTIAMGRNKLLSGPLAPFDGTRFLAAWPERTLAADAFVDFVVKDGKVTGFTMAKVNDGVDFSYDYQDLHFTRTR